MITAKGSAEVLAKAGNTEAPRLKGRSEVDPVEMAVRIVAALERSTGEAAVGRLVEVLGEEAGAREAVGEAADVDAKTWDERWTTRFATRSRE